MKGKRYEFKVEYDSYGHHKNYSKFFLREEEIKRFISELLVKYLHEKCDISPTELLRIFRYMDSDKDWIDLKMRWLWLISGYDRNSWAYSRPGRCSSNRFKSIEWPFILRAVKSAQSQRDFTRRLLIVSKTLHKNDLEVNVI